MVKLWYRSVLAVVATQVESLSLPMRFGSNVFRWISGLADWSRQHAGPIAAGALIERVLKNTLTTENRGMINSNRFNSVVTTYRPLHTVSLATADNSRNRAGFTLVELLVSMCVSLMLLGGVVSLFGTLGESVNDSKSNGEMLHTMRHAARQLQSDLGNVSLVPDPSETQTNPQGFFEYVEGPFNDIQAFSTEPIEQPCPDPIILDDGGSSFTAVTDGSNNIFKPFGNNRGKKKSYGESVHEKNSKYLKNEGVFEATGLKPGTYKVSLTWPIEWNTGNWATKTETRVPVKLFSGDNLVEDITVDQSQKPSTFQDPEGNTNGYGEPIWWKDIGGEVDVTDGKIKVQIGPCGIANGYTTSNMRVFADAIRIECLGLDPITQGGGNTDTLELVGDCDDVLHFTTKTDEGAFEVVWFLTPMPGYENRVGNEKRYRLHRYARPVQPDIDPLTNGDYSFGANDTPNSLSNLAKRENRFAHKSADAQYDVIPSSDYQIYLNKESKNPDGSIKWEEGERTRKTVILENVLAFDVQAYDPEVAIYSATVSGGQTVPLLPTDPGWSAAHQNADNVPAIGMGAFRDLDPAQADDLNSPLKTLSTANGPVATYDSWSGDYVKDGEVGFDNWNAAGQQVTDGIVDTAEDLREKPPYDAPLKAVQVEIRVQEPKSGKVRSVKVRKFLGKR